MIGAGLLMISDWLVGALGEGNTKNGLIESNWFTMEAWRFEIALLLAAIGVCLFYYGMKAMVTVVSASAKKADYREYAMTKMFSFGSVVAVVSTLFIQLVKIIVPIIYKELYETSLMGADIIFIVERVFHYMAIPYYALFIMAVVFVSIPFVYFIWIGRLRISALFYLLNPLVMYGLSYVFKMIKMVQIADFGVALVSLGYVLLFVGGALQLSYIVRRREEKKMRARRRRRG